MASNRLKCQTSAAFKMHGLTLRSEASYYLVEVLSNVPVSQRYECMDKLIEVIQKLPLHSSMIDRDICEKAVKELNEEDDEQDSQIFNVIDAFSIPRFAYSNERKKYIDAKSMGRNSPNLFPNADTKGLLFHDRYTALHQRTVRHKLFSPPVEGANPNDKSKKFQLRPIEYLLGSTSKLGDIIVLGMLTQMKQGKWYMEDPTGAVQLDLTRANFHTGLFTENCFVLAEGWYEDEVFHINAFGFPPPEPAKDTMKYLGNVNFFGGPSDGDIKLSEKLQNVETENESAMFVFLSDVWLDQVNVMEKLRTMFTGYAESPPFAFIFCGDFTSMPQADYFASNSKTVQKKKQLQELFGELASMISEFPQLVKESKFIFVPGPRDPGPGKALPRPPLADCLTESLRQRLPSAIFTTNPCRIQYCTQQMVIMREDIIMKMSRQCVRFPEDGDAANHFAKTIICQGHLCPLPLHVTPIYWAYDNALSIFPLPDIVVCADKFDPYCITQTDCIVMNPGSFPRSQFAFKVYIPHGKQVEDSMIE